MVIHLKDMKIEKQVNRSHYSMISNGGEAFIQCVVQMAALTFKISQKELVGTCQIINELVLKLMHIITEVGLCCLMGQP